MGVLGLLPVWLDARFLLLSTVCTLGEGDDEDSNLLKDFVELTLGRGVVSGAGAVAITVEDAITAACSFFVDGDSSGGCVALRATRCRWGEQSESEDSPTGPYRCPCEGPVDGDSELVNSPGAL